MGTTVEPGSVTLPLNVSLDLGSYRGTQHNLALVDTDPSWSRAMVGHKVCRHLDTRHKLSMNRERERALMSRKRREDEW